MNHRTTMSVIACAGLIVAGCFSNGESNKPSTSGDPEADQRASLRIGQDTTKSGKVTTLYERLGGRDKIAAFVSDFTTRVIADPRVNFERKDVKTNWVGGKYKAWPATAENIEQFRHHMTEFLVVATGGPAEYTGRDMKKVHEGMRITNNEFDAMVGDIKASMERQGYATREIRDLLAIVETTRKQIVEKPS